MTKNSMQSNLVKIRVGGGVSLHACHAVSECRSFSASEPVSYLHDPKLFRHATLGKTTNRKPGQPPSHKLQ